MKRFRRALLVLGLTITGCMTLNQEAIQVAAEEVGGTARESVAVNDMGTYEVDVNGCITSWKALTDVVVIPDGTTAIDVDVFPTNAVVKKIVIPASLTQMAYDSVEGLSRIRDLFDRCTSLEDIEVKDGNSVYTSRDGVLYKKVEDNSTIALYCPINRSGYVTLSSETKQIAAEAFKNCKKVTLINMGEMVMQIEAEAFMNCTSLIELPLTESITYIGNQAFYGCAGISEVTIPSRVNFIGEGAFSCGSNLTKMTVSKTNAKYKMKGKFLLNKKGTKLVLAPSGIEGKATIPDYITRIGVAAFSDCYNLEQVVMGDQVKEIGEYAFVNCKALKKVKLSDSIGEIKIGVFSGCSALESFTIPNGVHSIMEDAFTDCTHLIKMMVPASVKRYISTEGFSRCINLVFYGKQGSAIETYAEDYNFGFSACVTEPARTILKANKKDKRVYLYWKRVSKTKGYVIYQSKKKNGTYKKLVTIKGEKVTSFTHKGIKNGKTTYYKVRPYRMDGKKKCFGHYSFAI